MNWYFGRGSGVQTKKTLRGGGGVWIFSGVIQMHFQFDVM